MMGEGYVRKIFFFFSLLPLTLILSLWTEEEQIYHSLLGTDTPLLSGVREAF